MARTIADLRDHLFAALDGLTDKDNPMDIERARAVSEVAQTIINSAKVEVDFIRATDGKDSGFLSAEVTPALPPGITIRQHRLR